MTAGKKKKSRLQRAKGWDVVIFIALTLIAIMIFLPSTMPWSFPWKQTGRTR
jgi:hypothetical protein